MCYRLSRIDVVSLGLLSKFSTQICLRVSVKRWFDKAYWEAIAEAFASFVGLGLLYGCSLLVINSIGGVLQSVSFYGVICVKS